MTELLIFIIGLIFGSFLNVLIYRLPLNISLLNPKRSACPNCDTTIKWYENIPLLSYVMLKGKCPNCNIKISVRYPLVELLSATISVLVFIKMGLSIDFLVTIMLFYTLIVLSFIDFEYKAVPDYILITALVISFLISNFSFKDALIFAGGFVLLELFITFYIQNIKARITKNEELRSQKALGEGDIPIVAIIGGVLGIKLGIMAIFLSAILAILPALYTTLIKKDIEIPFIPYLTFAFAICYIFDNHIKYLW
jgi:leader peptidase (prepilin peptidase)/N-methyltransferase